MMDAGNHGQFRTIDEPRARGCREAPQGFVDAIMEVDSC